jgi:hypothetical protein
VAILSVFGIATAELPAINESETSISRVLLRNAQTLVAGSDSPLIVVPNADQPAYRV